MLAISIVSLLDAGYLTVKHFENQAPNCSVIQGCDKVTTSEYSMVLGIPTAFVGALYYLIVFSILILFLIKKHRRYFVTAVLAGIPAAMMAVWLLYLQGFVIGAFCEYCLVIDGGSLVFLWLGLYEFRVDKRMRAVTVD